MILSNLTSLCDTICTKLQYYCVVYMLIPGTVIFQMTVVYPNLVQMFDAGILRQCFHLCIITFLFINVVGNLIFSMIKDSILKRPVYGEGLFCETCRMARPAKSWHCKRCNVCVLKRDHHCSFLASCIGYNNQRYFLLFLGYVWLSMVYITYYNIQYVSLKYEEDGWLLSAGRIFNPMLRFIFIEPMGIKDVYVSYLFMNVASIIWSGSLFFYHTRNVVMGVTSYESRYPELMNSSRWKQNMLSVFGTRWYLAMVWPLADSPLPRDDDKDP